MIKRIICLLLNIAILISACFAGVKASSNTINIGDYVLMGTYYNQPILWRCVDIDENGPLMLSDRILCLKAFDAKGDSQVGSHARINPDEKIHNRKKYGSNYWADSNMRCWLNSTAKAGEVIWACGNAPSEFNLYTGSEVYNSYDYEAGFLTNFTVAERNAMKVVTQKSILSKGEFAADIEGQDTPEPLKLNYFIKNVVQNYDSAYSEQVTDTMFLLDVKQLYAVYTNSSILGDKYYFGKPTQECINKSQYKDSNLSTDSKWYSWLRSPSAESLCGYEVYVVGYEDLEVFEDFIDVRFAWDSYYGVRPAFYLDDSNFDYGNGTLSAPYGINPLEDCYAMGFNNIPGGVIDNKPEGELSTITDLYISGSNKSIALDAIVSPGATWALYRTKTATTPLANNTLSLTVGRMNVAYLRVTSEDGKHTRQYMVSIYCQPPSETPTISNERTLVTITAKAGATIKYTTDGSDPSFNNGITYAGPFQASLDTVIKAIAKDSDDYGWSAVAQKTVYYVKTKCSAPTITNERGLVTITAEAGSVVRYTTDGTEPTATNGKVYTNPFTVPYGTTIKAYASNSAKDLDSDASVHTVIYELIKCATPTISCHRGRVTITAEAGSVIKYTTDGSEPCATNGTIYTGVFVVQTGTVVKAYAYDDNKDIDSDVVCLSIVNKEDILLTPIDFYKNAKNGYSYDFYLEKITDKNASIVIAFYKAGKLTGVAIKAFELNGVETELVGNIDAIYDADTYRAFVVNSILGLAPLSNAVEGIIE